MDQKDFREVRDSGVYAGVVVIEDEDDEVGPCAFDDCACVLAAAIILVGMIFLTGAIAWGVWLLIH